MALQNYSGNTGSSAGFFGRKPTVTSKEAELVYSAVQALSEKVLKLGALRPNDKAPQQASDTLNTCSRNIRGIISPSLPNVEVAESSIQSTRSIK